MRFIHPVHALVPVLMLVLVACGDHDSIPRTPIPAAAAAPTTAATLAPPTAVPPAEVPPTPAPADAPTAAPAEEAPQLSFTPATYTNEAAGFEFDYPAGWTLDPSSVVGVRGGQALLLSPGTTLETLAEGGTRLSILIYQWDPKNDLDAYVAQRKTAWDASGFPITREEQWQLADGRTVHAFELQTPERPSFTILTTVGEDYLQLAGEGNLPLVEEIVHTLRSLP